jgi:hypothetical protein
MWVCATFTVAASRRISRFAAAITITEPSFAITKASTVIVGGSSTELVASIAATNTAITNLLPASTTDKPSIS